MTSLTDTQVITASGGLVELGYSERTTNVQINTASSSPGITVIDNLTFVSDGSPLLIEFSATNVSPTSPSYLAFNLWIDGVMSGQIGAFTSSFGRCDARRRVTLSAGSHTVKVTGYYAGGGSGGWVYSGDATSGNDHPAFLRVSKIVQATQWPAVTTGTVICTSSTRPASPFEGQRIYETDTNKEWVYDGAAWYSPGLQREEKNTSQVTVTTAADVTGMTTGSNFTAVSGRKYRATFYCSQAYGTAGERMAVTLLSGSTTFQAGYFGLSPSTGGSVICITGTFTASGVTTVKVRAARDIGTNNAFLYADANSPLTLTVEDIGPA